MEDNIRKRMYVCITGSLCCTAEIDNKIILIISQLNSNKKIFLGVPVVAQWLTDPTRNHEVAGLIPGLAQWANDLALP